MNVRFKKTRRPKVGDGLTDREFQVVALVAEGKVNKEIADAMGGISEHTVKFHLWHIAGKMGIAGHGPGARVLMAVRYVKGEIIRRPIQIEA